MKNKSVKHHFLFGVRKIQTTSIAIVKIKNI